MNAFQQSRAILVLADGTAVEGFAVGRRGIAKGELCAGGQSDYRKIFTDPLYYSKLVLNSGQRETMGSLNQPPTADRIMVAGYIGDDIPSNRLLLQHLERNNIVGIGGINVRTLISTIRFKGAMHAIISSTELDKHKLLQKLQRKSSAVNRKREPLRSGNFSKVAVIDLGKTEAITRRLMERGCTVRVFPRHTFHNEINSWHPDGILLSDGPEDPHKIFRHSGELINYAMYCGQPVIGIGLGFQLMAMAAGFSVSRRAARASIDSHPVKQVMTRQIRVMSGHHAFSVDANEAPQHTAEITHVNINDQSIAGLRFKNYLGFGLQWMPEEDDFTFNHFADLLKIPAVRRQKELFPQVITGLAM